MSIETPEWVHNAVFYQVFPDRFSRSNRTKQVQGIQFKPWGTPPEEQGYQGGDLRGVVDRLDHIQALGANAIYLNPIFSSAANHRYHAFDYFQVDPLLGGNEALRELLDAAHARGMRVILDGVFNHASRGFWPFHHILENGRNSPYIDWFHIKGWPLRPYSSGDNEPLNYEAWWGIPGLPKINTSNPGARQYLFDVARHWIEFGADGWRLDVAADINDVSFWQEFRQIVKGVNPEAYIVGEIWHEARHWLQGDQFDAVMNYFFGKACVSFFAADSMSQEFKHPDYTITPKNAEEFGREIAYFLGLYDWQINLAQLNMIDSHDTPRGLYLMGGDKDALRLTVLMLMTMPGAPCIYYGSEIGMTGAGDPYCREAFPWENPGSWDHELLDHYQRAISLRHTHAVLRTGGYAQLIADGRVFGFSRRMNGAEAVVLLNAGPDPIDVRLQPDMVSSHGYYQVWPHNQGRTVLVGEEGASVPVEGHSGVVLINQNSQVDH